ncbi:hypothetical protein [Leptospira adleri]|nr:hypothetical protein [Leptospira adleri]
MPILFETCGVPAFLPSPKCRFGLFPPARDMKGLVRQDRAGLREPGMARSCGSKVGTPSFPLRIFLEAPITQDAAEKSTGVPALFLTSK